MAIINNSIIKSIRESANSYACMSQFSEITGFMNNPNNEPYLMATYEMYGIPPINRPSYKNSGLFGRWNDFCDWDRGIYKFYHAAKLIKAYSVIDITQDNCNNFKELDVSLEQEKLNADKVRLFDPNTADVMLQAINDLQTKYNVAYANLDCETYLEELAKEKIKSEITEQEAKTEEIINKITPTKIFIGAIVASIIGVGLLLLLKKKD